MDLFDILSMLSRKCAGMIMAVGHAFAWILRFAYRKRSFVVVAQWWRRWFYGLLVPPNQSPLSDGSRNRINVIDAFYFHDQVASLNRFCVNNDRVAMSSLLGLKPQVCNRILSANSFSTLTSCAMVRLMRCAMAVMWPTPPSARWRTVCSFVL